MYTKTVKTQLVSLPNSCYTEINWSYATWLTLLECNFNNSLECNLNTSLECNLQFANKVILSFGEMKNI